MTSALSLAGKSALVTGGARRIGRAIALALAHAGADVAISYRISRTKPRRPPRISPLSAAAAVVAMRCALRIFRRFRCRRSCIAELGRLDILVNNAAVFASAALESLTLDQWDDVFDTNTRGPFLVAREALPHLRAAHGRIVNIGSLGGLHAWAGHAHYCASKAALHMLTQAMAKAFAPDVSVNCVAPGWIEMDDSSAPPEIRVAPSFASDRKRRAGRKPHASPRRPRWAAMAAPMTSLRLSSSSPPDPASSPARSWWSTAAWS